MKGEALSRRMIALGLAVWAFCQPFSVAGANVGIGLAVAGLAGWGLTTRRFPSLKSPLAAPLWAFFLVGALTGALGVDWGHSVGEIKNYGQMLLDFYIFSAAFAVEGGSRVLGCWAAGFLIAALLGLGQVAGYFGPAPLRDVLQRLSDSSQLWAFLGPSDRARGTLYAVTYGELLGMALLGWFCWRAVRRRDQAPPAPRGGGAAVPVVFALAVVAALAVNGTRGAWLGVLAGGLLVAAFEFDARTAAEIALGVALLAAGGLLSPRFYQSKSGFSPSEPSFYLHRQLWKVGWRMFLDHPLLGVGIRNFGELSARYNPALFGGMLWDQADSLYLNQLAEQGIVGLCALLALFGTMLWQGWRNYRRSRSFQSLWFFAWMFAFLFMNLTECAWRRAMIFMPTLALYCWMEQSSKASEP